MSATSVTQRLITVDTIYRCRWNTTFFIFLQTRLTQLLTSRLTGDFSDAYQMLNKKVMLKTTESFWWNLEFLPTQWTRYHISCLLVLEITFKTLETESMDTRQWLWVVKHFQTNRTSCPVCGNWCSRCHGDSSGTQVTKPKKRHIKLPILNNI